MIERMGWRVMKDEANDKEGQENWLSRAPVTWTHMLPELSAAGQDWPRGEDCITRRSKKTEVIHKMAPGLLTSTAFIFGNFLI